MTQYRLEQRSGVFHGVMNRILTGKNSTVTLITLYKLANGFHMSLVEFLSDAIFFSEDIEIE
ncbi:MAG: helix-turn-helix transcriptional regulator [Clostridiales bacterium]|nr:helix-turn-helix transcriptional regulator [Clostridiales bacterium]